VIGSQFHLTKPLVGVVFLKIICLIFFQPFFVERVFHIFDKDDNGSISLQEFIDAMHQFAGQSPDDKIKFLFKVYDIDGKK
jgi:Ca2+-binding EF-hand superfamily protein